MYLLSNITVTFVSHFDINTNKLISKTFLNEQPIIDLTKHFYIMYSHQMKLYNELLSSFNGSNTSLAYFFRLCENNAFGELFRLYKVRRTQLGVLTYFDPRNHENTGLSVEQAKSGVGSITTNNGLLVATCKTVDTCTAEEITMIKKSNSFKSFDLECCLLDYDDNGYYINNLNTF